jgi:hypothetical protein
MGSKIKIIGVLQSPVAVFGKRSAINFLSK